MREIKLYDHELIVIFIFIEMPEYANGDISQHCKIYIIDKFIIIFESQ